MIALTRVIRTACIATLLAFVAACDDDPTGPREPGPPSQLTVVSGTDQTAVVGARLAAPIVVRVADSAGVALRGIAVEFAVTSGGGSTTGAVITDSLGIASTQWTLGTSIAQPQQLRVRVVHPGGQPETTVTARATAAAASTASRIAGEAQTGDLGQQLTTPLSIRVTDQFGNPVAGVPVAWVVTSGGGSVSSSVQPTDSAGLSTVRWTLGSRLDVAQGVTAATTVGGPITFTATPRLPASATLTAVTGAPTSGTVGREIPTPFSVLLRLASGAPVEGADVTWSVVSGQATVAPTVTRTGPTGIVSARLTPGNTPGQVVLAASIPGLQDVRFNVTVNADVPATMTVVGGNNQTQPIGTLLPLPLIVSVADRFGNPLTGVNVSWSVTAGGGTVTPVNAVTDAGGRASTTWRLGNTSGTQTVIASVPGTTSATFNATAQSGAVASLTVSPATASITPNGTTQLTAVMRDQFGNLITDRTPTWTTSDTLVARVSQTGLVTGITDGTATVTAAIDGRTASSTITVATPPSIPATPSNLIVEPQGAGSVLLSWQLNSTNATRVEVQYRPANTTVWLDRPALQGHATVILISGLEPGAGYEFQVRTCNNLGCSAFSPTVTGTTGS